jgi:hypothetical protein
MRGKPAAALTNQPPVWHSNSRSPLEIQNLATEPSYYYHIEVGEGIHLDGGLRGLFPMYVQRIGLGDII